jgi:hypothetical protein
VGLGGVVYRREEDGLGFPGDVGVPGIGGLPRKEETLLPLLDIDQGAALGGVAVSGYMQGRFGFDVRLPRALGLALSAQGRA